jgi:hypothetical protein
VVPKVSEDEIAKPLVIKYEMDPKEEVQVPKAEK